MLTEDQRRFLETARVARFATADAGGQPHVVPVCHAMIGDRIYFTIDEKPKRKSVLDLKRLANIRSNPKAALVVDRYDEDWSALGWVMIQGPVDMLEGGEEHAAAQAALCERYPQLRAMRIEGLPVVAITIGRVMSWGKLGGRHP